APTAAPADWASCKPHLAACVKQTGAPGRPSAFRAAAAGAPACTRPTCAARHAPARAGPSRTGRPRARHRPATGRWLCVPAPSPRAGIPVSIAQLAGTAQALVAPGKGIVAIDESTGTIGKRFAALGVDNSEQNRRAWRELLLTTPRLAEHISGAILFDETLRQSTAEGVPFPAYLAAQGILPGIKVDRGTVALAGYPDELVTEGLDGLRERLQEYYALGARFAKWRAVIRIGEDVPT